MTGRLLIFVIASGLFIGTLPACTILESSLGDILDPADPNDPNDPNADPNDPNAPDPNVPADDGTDTDGDGLSDVREAEEGTDVDDVDSDNDGLSDGEEVLTLHFDPVSTDSDNAGFADGREVPSGFQPSLDVTLGRVDTPLCDEFLSIAAAHGASVGLHARRGLLRHARDRAARRPGAVRRDARRPPLQVATGAGEQSVRRLAP